MPCISPYSWETIRISKSAKCKELWSLQWPFRSVVQYYRTIKKARGTEAVRADIHVFHSFLQKCEINQNHFHFSVENSPDWFMHLQYVECLSRDITSTKSEAEAIRVSSTVVDVTDLINKELSQIHRDEYVCRWSFGHNKGTAKTCNTCSLLVFSDDDYVQYSIGYELCELKSSIGNRVHLDKKNKEHLIKLMKKVHEIWKGKLWVIVL